MLTAFILFAAVHLFCAWLGGKIADFFGFSHRLGFWLGLLLNFIGVVAAIAIGIGVHLERGSLRGGN